MHTPLETVKNIIYIVFGPIHKATEKLTVKTFKSKTFFHNFVLLQETCLASVEKDPAHSLLGLRTSLVLVLSSSISPVTKPKNVAVVSVATSQRWADTSVQRSLWCLSVFS